MTSRTFRNSFTCLSAAFIGCCWIGCGGVYDASVTGTVTLDGQPLHRGTVAFSPADGGPKAYAVVQDDGVYAMTTGREEGLPSGQYHVTVVARHPPELQTSRGGGPPPPGKPITPPWYQNQKTSGLTFMVESGANQINIELTSEPPPGWKPKKRRRRSR